MRFFKTINVPTSVILFHEGCSKQNYKNTLIGYDDKRSKRVDFRRQTQRCFKGQRGKAREYDNVQPYTVIVCLTKNVRIAKMYQMGGWSRRNGPCWSPKKQLFRPADRIDGRHKLGQTSACSISNKIFYFSKVARNSRAQTYRGAGLWQGGAGVKWNASCLLLKPKTR